MERTPADRTAPAYGHTVQRGSALVLAVFVLFVLAGTGISLLFLAQLEMAMSRSDVVAKQTFYVAEAGIEDGRMTLFAADVDEDFADDLAGAAGANGTIDFDPATVVVTYSADGQVAGFSGFGDDVPLRGLTPLGSGAYAAFLTNDPDEGRAVVTDGNRRVMVIGVGAASGGALEVVEAIVEPRGALPPMPPAALTLLGSAPSFDSGTSSSSLWDGNDCSGAGVPGLYAPVVGATSDAAEVAIEAGYNTDSNGNGPDFVSGPYGGDLGNPADVIANLADTAEPTMGSHAAIDPGWSDCTGLVAMVETLRAAADYVCEHPTDCNVPDGTFGYAPDSIVFVDGNASLGDADAGSGLLVVTGQLQMNGGASWDGVILALGQGRVVRQGSGGGGLSGSIVVGDLAGPDQTYGTADDCTGSGDGFGSARFHVIGGGNGDLSFCQQVREQADPVVTLRVADFRQR